eukprot:6117930-Amphidinium_carterae.2
MQKTWEIATPEYLAGESEAVESIRFLGMEIETDHDWIIHQQPYVVETLHKFCPSLIIRKRITSGDAEGFARLPPPPSPSGQEGKTTTTETSQEPVDVSWLEYISLYTRVCCWATSICWAAAVCH